MNKKLLRILITAVLLVIAITVEHNASLPVGWLLLIYLVPYVLIGYDVLAEAVEGVMEGDPFDEDFLMAVATIGALLIGFLPGAESQMPEAVFVMLFFQVGELFEDYAEDKSRDSIAQLMDIRPDSAHVIREGQTVTIAPDEVKTGEIIEIKPGEKVPLDGVVTSGTSTLDTVALTGESIPRQVTVGEEIMSGCINLSGLLQVRVTRPFGLSTVCKIINLVEHAAERKSKSETFISKFAHVYTPIVVLAAVVTAFIPPLFYDGYLAALNIWLYRALTFLVVSCPCALVISVPLTFFGGIGGASRKGILIKGGNYIDTLAKADVVVLDKTGTLTEGVFEVEAIHPDKISANELLHLAAHVERNSTHPIAVSLKNAYVHEADDCVINDVTETAGRGITATVNGRKVSVGNALMMDEMGIAWKPCHHVGTIVHVAIDGVYAGHIVIADRIKEDAATALAALRKLGLSRMVMLTGDREEVGKHVADTVGIDEYHAQLLPDEKVTCLERIMHDKPDDKRVLFVGDGINDAPVLARADVGIAMGALGSDAAIEAADVVIMDDKPSKIATAISIARKTVMIARQNVWFAIGVKIAVLLLAAIGQATMGMAVFADVGVMVLAVINAMRTLRI